MVMATVAPAGGAVAILPLAIGLGVGIGTPGMYVFVLVIMLLFAVGFTRMVPYGRHRELGCIDLSFACSEPEHRRGIEVGTVQRPGFRRGGSWPP